MEIKKVMGKGVVMLEMVEEEEEGWVWLGTLEKVELMGNGLKWS